MRICCLQHTENPGDTYLTQWAEHHGHIWECILVPAANELPRLREVDCLVVLGGPMSVWEEDRYPWLRKEKFYIEGFIEAEKPVLGICLGVQLLADVLGARTYKGSHKEIGWFTAETAGESRQTWLGDTLPARFETFLWHGDSYELPDGAVRLARSDAFENQGFIWNQTLGLQFHLEVTPDWVNMLANRDAGELVAAPYVQSADVILGKPASLYLHNNALMNALLQKWLGSVRPGQT